MINISKIQEDKNNEMKDITENLDIFLYFFIMLIVSNIQTSLLRGCYRNKICFLLHLLNLTFTG